MIKNIAIEKIQPHPENPRKDLGDLTELVESIKARGILQNLTVVPAGVPEDTFVALIGHRRLAAARLAGLKEVPCSVVKMGTQEQISTMLVENMQRADLTVYEQAQGMQAILDFGGSIPEIAKQTGFSETTVRRRVRLLELDQDKFAESAKRNVTLMDYVRLEEIKGLELRNKVLESAGTSNFEYELRKAIDQEKREVWLADAIVTLETFATRVDSESGPLYQEYRCVADYYSSRNDEITVPEDASETEYFFSVTEYGSLSLWVKRGSVSADDEEEARRRELRKAKYNSLQEVSERAYDLRCEFVRAVSESQAKKNISKIVEGAIGTMLTRHIGNVDPVDLANLLDVDLSEDDDKALQQINEAVQAKPHKAMLSFAYCLVDRRRETYYGWSCSHQPNEQLDQVYGFLLGLGYEISDEEQAMRDGTHELFEKEVE